MGTDLRLMLQRYLSPPQPSPTLGSQRSPIHSEEQYTGGSISPTLFVPRPEASDEGCATVPVESKATTGARAINTNPETIGQAKGTNGREPRRRGKGESISTLWSLGSSRPNSGEIQALNQEERGSPARKAGGGQIGMRRNRE